MLGPRGLIGVGVVTVLAAGSVAAVSHGSDGEVRARPGVASEWRPPTVSSLTTLPAAPVAPPPRGEPEQPLPEAAAVGLQRFGDCGSLLERVRTAVMAEVTPWGLTTGAGVPAGTPAGAAPAGEAAASGGSATSGGSGGGNADSPAFSSTNVQEAGVDEPDLVRNDARRAFSVFGSRLRAVVFEDGVRAAGELDLGLRGEVELLEVGDRLVALGWDGAFATSIAVVDAADPDSLRVVHRIEVEGAYVSARRIGDTVRLVVTQNGPAFEFTYPTAPDGSDTARALARNRAAVQRAELAEWLPDVSVAGRDRLVPAPPCGSTYVTNTFAGPGSTTVLTLSPADGTVLDATSVLATASEVYATRDHLYVATSAWSSAPTITTEIHRFDVSDPTRSVYEASGSVPGHLLQPPWFVGTTNLGQWSLSEHADHLRVATTVVGQAELSNSVTVLGRAGDRLVPVGAITGLGVNEQLYAVRFMGTRGYVVTYRKVDPLFVLELSDPTAPRVVGQLKVPGYSAYLHPIGDGLLLGVGQADDDEDGMADGTHVSLFDVRDPARPQQQAVIKLGERGSLAGVESDHRSFTWWPDPARAVLTMTNWEDPTRFQGAIAVEPRGGSLREVGRVEHLVEGAPAAPIVRSRVIGDALVTFSRAGVEVHALDDLAPRASLRYERPAAPSARD